MQDAAKGSFIPVRKKMKWAPRLEEKGWNGDVF
jgi:hypothetical protein